MDLVETVSKILGEQVTIEEAKSFAIGQFGALATWLREEGDKDKFPNGFTNWYETHHEIVCVIEKSVDDETFETEILFSRGGQYELAHELTNKFENKYKGEQWENLSYFDTLEEFCEFELNI